MVALLSLQHSSQSGPTSATILRMNPDAVSERWSTMARAFEITPAAKLPQLLGERFEFEPTGEGFASYVEDCLAKTGVDEDNADQWRLALVAEFAIQVDKVMAMLLKERVDDEHDKLTRDDAEAFLKDRAPVIIQGLL